MSKTITGDLNYYLLAIEVNEAAGNYDARNVYTWLALGQAARLGYTCGVRLDPADPEWPVVYIDLPTGQVSWHTPQYPNEWDQHTTEEKYNRIRTHRYNNPKETT